MAVAVIAAALIAAVGTIANTVVFALLQRRKRNGDRATEALIRENQRLRSRLDFLEGELSGWQHDRP